MADNKTLLYVGLGVGAYFLLSGKLGTNPTSAAGATTPTQPGSSLTTSITNLINSIFGITSGTTSSAGTGGNVNCPGAPGCPGSSTATTLQTASGTITAIPGDLLEDGTQAYEDANGNIVNYQGYPAIDQNGNSVVMG